MTLLKSIKLDLTRKLRNKSYRDEFFYEFTNDQVAQQIRELRKKRGLNQAELAEITGTTQSAISRLEQADYSSWGFQTLVSIARGLDARLNFVLEPAEVVMEHYERLEIESAQDQLSVDDSFTRQADTGTGTTNEATMETLSP